MWNIWRFEWRNTMRQNAYYMLSVLWIGVLSLLFLLERNTPSLSGYTNITGTIVNLLLYILPLFMLIIGSFSITNEIENGQWRLLCTYPLPTMSYLAGKLGGQYVAQIAMFTFSFGVSLIIGLISGVAFELKWVVSLYVFSILLLFAFLILGVTVGVFSRTRWQALAVSVAVWFLFIMMWPVALISVLNFVPYNIIGTVLKISLFCNPAELLRVLFVISLDGGAVFGQSYDSLVTFFQSKQAWLVLGLYLICYTAFLFFLATWRMERRKTQ
ncbi:ABC transporter permease [Microbacteriaceae bacterium 4G12]